MGSSGVYVVQTLFEDESYSPADAGTARDWVSSLGARYAVWAEPDPPYGESSSIPATWVIDAETMRVVNMGNGFDSYAERAVGDTLSRSPR